MWLTKRLCRTSGEGVAKSYGSKSSLERLEDRTVFSVDFLSAMNLGAAGSDGTFDVTSVAAGNGYVTGYFSGTSIRPVRTGEMSMLSSSDSVNRNRGGRLWGENAHGIASLLSSSTCRGFSSPFFRQ